MISLAVKAEEIRLCHEVMRELRPHLDVEAFTAQVLRQIQNGYHLAYVKDQGEIRAAAGFRISECLAWGKFLYVDDLITREIDRSRGYGAQLMDWLIARAKAEGCAQLHLDSGVHRFAAHRFYFSRRMAITSHHFGLELR